MERQFIIATLALTVPFSSCCSRPPKTKLPESIRETRVVTLPDAELDHQWADAREKLVAELAVAMFAGSTSLGSMVESMMRLAYPIPRGIARAAVLKALREQLDLVPTFPHPEAIDVVEYYPGKFRGILWWRRQWQERVTYTVLILTTTVSGETPGTVVRVHFVSEERPNDEYSWEICESGRAEKRVLKLVGFLDRAIWRQCRDNQEASSDD